MTVSDQLAAAGGARLGGAGPRHLERVKAHRPPDANTLFSMVDHGTLGLGISVTGMTRRPSEFS